MSAFLSKVGKILKVISEAVISLLKYIFEGIKNFIEKNQLGEKIKEIREESIEKIQSGLEAVKREQQERENKPLPKNVNISKLGQFLDGWAELIEGEGEKADLVRHDTLERLNLKEMPEVNLVESIAHNSSYTEQRDYVFSNTSQVVCSKWVVLEFGELCIQKT